MNPNNGKDSVFSSSKPKELPWFFVPVLIGVICLVVLYKWFT